MPRSPATAAAGPPIGRERTNQKIRTRNALVAAARELVVRGTLPSISEVAEAALVSPATAYRYFPDRIALLREAVRQMPPEVQEKFRPDVDLTLDLPERMAQIARKFLPFVLEREQLVRAMMLLSAQQAIEESGEAPPLRRNYRVAWIDEALHPEEKRFPAAEFRRLRLSLIAVLSAESLFLFKDQFGLSSDEAVETCAWGARRLVEAALRSQEKSGRSK